MDGDKKLGGFIYYDNRLILYPFLISPNTDRTAFWSFIIDRYSHPSMSGILDADRAVLQNLGYRPIKLNQVMVRPAEVMHYELKDGFTCRDIDIDADLAALCEVDVKAYRGSYFSTIEGEITLEKATEEMNYVFNAYDKASFSKVIADDSGKIVAFCLSGMYSSFAEIGELCVLPEYRNMGLASYLMARSITDASGKADYVKLFVLIGNPAERLYRSMNFFGGPRFAEMKPIGD